MARVRVQPKVLEKIDRFKILVPSAIAGNRLLAEKLAREFLAEKYLLRFCEVKLTVQEPDGFQVILESKGKGE
jgi:hypothetical protein